MNENKVEQGEKKINRNGNEEINRYKKKKRLKPEAYEEGERERRERIKSMQWEGLKQGKEAEGKKGK